MCSLQVGCRLPALTDTTPCLVCRLPMHGGEGELAMMSSFCRWLNRAGVLGFTMVGARMPALGVETHCRHRSTAAPLF